MKISKNQLRKIIREATGGGLNEDKYWDERRRAFVPVEDWSPGKLKAEPTLVGVVEQVRDVVRKTGNQEAVRHLEAAIQALSK
jgi:hypothetical protein